MPVLHRELSPDRSALKALGARGYRAVASTSTIDRHGDVVEQSGWHLDNSKRNPIILWWHLYDRMPIARATYVAVEGDRLVIEGGFPEPGVSRLADDCAALINSGLLNACSVGFLPLRSTPLPDGRGTRYLEQELLEVSLTPIPANPEALLVPALLGQRANPEHPRREARALAQLRRGT
jgi:HK97 family phage prohead protease